MTTTTSRRRFPISWVITIGLAALLLVLAFRGVDWNGIVATAQKGDLSRLALGFAIVSLSYFMRAMRWRVLLSAEKTLHPLTVFWGTCAGYLGNSFLPARAGELIRSALISQRSGISTGYVLATALTERIMDAGFLVVVAIAILSTMVNMPNEILVAMRVTALLGVGGIIGLLIAPRIEGFIQRMIQRLPLPPALSARIASFVEQFLLGVRAFQNPQRAFGFAVFTLIAWSLDVIASLQIAGAFGIVVTPAQMLLLLAALGLASAAPSTPGYVGIYQFVAVTVLPPFGVTQDEALVFILALQGVTYLVVIIWGFLGLWRLKAGRAAEETALNSAADTQ